MTALEIKEVMAVRPSEQRRYFVGFWKIFLHGF